MNNLTTAHAAGWLFGLLVATIGVANLTWVHPVPATAFLLFSLIYLPPINALFRSRFQLTFPPAIKIAIGILLIWFTLGVSDLGDMIDKW